MGKWSKELLKDYAFFDSLFQFFLIGRHVALCSSVNQVNIFYACISLSGSCNVHSGVSRTDYDNVLT